MTDTDVWFFLLGVLIVALHFVVADKFKRNVWKWGFLGLFFGIFSFIWLLVIGKKND